MNLHQGDLKEPLDDIMRQYNNLEFFFKVHLIELVMSELARKLMQHGVLINPNDGIITWCNGSKLYPPVNDMQQQKPEPVKGRGRGRPPKNSQNPGKPKGKGKGKSSTATQQQDPPSAIQYFVHQSQQANAAIDEDAEAEG